MQIADVDFDGNNEIILGTFGQKILIYKQQQQQQQQPPGAQQGLGITEEFSLIYQQGFAQPILGLHWADMSSDGANNLVIVSLTGVHILSVR
jgi:hypothetical protein